MLLWYVALAVPSLVSLAVGVLTIVDFFGRKRADEKAAGMGGFVTHSQHTAALKEVYDYVRMEVRGAVSEFKEAVKELTRDVKAASADVHKLEGQIEGMPSAVRRKV